MEKAEPVRAEQVNKRRPITLADLIDPEALKKLIEMVKKGDKR